MESLTLEGDKYLASFQEVEKKKNSPNEDFVDVASGNFNCWFDQKMWWEGKAILANKFTGREIRVTFETVRRRDVEGGIRDETFEESFLLVRGRVDRENFISYRGGREVVTDKNKVIDYLLGRVYAEASDRGRTEFIPHLKIPLLEQHDLAEKGYAKPEPTIVQAR